MPRKIRNLLLALVVIFVLAVLTAVVMSTARSPRGNSLPNPNGYDDFLKAGALLKGDVTTGVTLDHDGLRGLVSTNAESLRLLRLGLTRGCSVPTDVAITNVGAMMTDMGTLKALALLLRAEGRLAELEDRPADAAQNYIEAIRLGNEISRGGFLINRLVGVACEAIGATPLAKLASGLTCEQARPLIAELEMIDTAQVTWEEVRQNENRFARSQINRIGNPIGVLVAWWQGRQARQKAEARHTLAVAHVRLLAVELALRCYQFEQGRAPARLEELVPSYLQRVPPDPFTRRPLIYRPRGTNWQLYSVGTDKVDDGGMPVGRGTSSKGDLFFDSPW